MDKYKVSYSPTAVADIKGIYAYITMQLKERQIATNQVNRIRTAVRGLETMPLRNALVDFEPWNSQGMRKLLVGNYIAYYLTDEVTKEVTVIRVLYGGRDIKSILKDE